MNTNISWTDFDWDRFQCLGNGIVYALVSKWAKNRLYDTKEQSWEENYTLPAHHVSGLSWDAAPDDYGLSMQWDAEGIIPIEGLVRFIT